MITCVTKAETSSDNSMILHLASADNLYWNKSAQFKYQPALMEKQQYRRVSERNVVSGAGAKSV